ncbi:TetR/AcrR family transcriptional regulator [Clavibacter nebraskensis]
MSDSDHVAVYDTNGGSGRSDPQEAEDDMSAASDPADAAGTGATGATGLRERRRMATTTEISEAALALFEQRGMAATTIHDIAQAAGVSDRTCFRYFPSKEESVLTLHPVFDAPLDAWLADVDRGSAPLPQLESVYERVLATLDGDLSAIAHQQLRVRRLMAAEPQLRSTAVSLDATRSWELAERMTTAFGGRITAQEARLVTEFAGVAVRAAFDEWADARTAGLDATLVASYAAVRRRLRAIAGTGAA